MLSNLSIRSFSGHCLAHTKQLGNIDFLRAKRHQYLLGSLSFAARISSSELAPNFDNMLDIKLKIAQSTAVGEQQVQKWQLSYVC